MAVIIIGLKISFEEVILRGAITLGYLPVGHGGTLSEQDLNLIVKNLCEKGKTFPESTQHMATIDWIAYLLAALYEYKFTGEERQKGLDLSQFRYSLKHGIFGYYVTEYENAPLGKKERIALSDQVKNYLFRFKIVSRSDTKQVGLWVVKE
jgi:hypothetical protein